MSDIMIMDESGEWTPLGYLTEPMKFESEAEEQFINLKTQQFQMSFELDAVFRESAFGAPTFWEVLFGSRKKCKYEDTKPIFDLYSITLPSETLEKPLTIDIYNLKAGTVGVDMYKEQFEARGIIDQFLYYKHLMGASEIDIMFIDEVNTDHLIDDGSGLKKFPQDTFLWESETGENDG